LEHAQPTARGRWYVVVDSGVLLDRFAIEASLEFAGTGEGEIDLGRGCCANRPRLTCWSTRLRLENDR